MSLPSSSKNYLDPLLAIVPKLSIISSFVIPTPVSSIVIVLFYSSRSTFMKRSADSYPFNCEINLCFSRASEAFERSSLKKTSLSVYKLLAMISRIFLVSVLNSYRSYFIVQNL